jgi:hypothetical protein
VSICLTAVRLKGYNNGHIEQINENNHETFPTAHRETHLSWASLGSSSPSPEIILITGEDLTKIGKVPEQALITNPPPLASAKRFAD